MWYSDDGGETYTLSEAVLEKMDEAQLVELSDGRVMANMRNDHLTSCDCRAVAISTDGGKTFGDISYDPALISPVRLRLAVMCVNCYVTCFVLFCAGLHGIHHSNEQWITDICQSSL